MDLSTLFRVKKVVFSLEVFPPKKDNPVHVIYNTLLGLRGRQRRSAEQNL